MSKHYHERSELNRYGQSRVANKQGRTAVLAAGLGQALAQSPVPWPPRTKLSKLSAAGTNAFTIGFKRNLSAAGKRLALRTVSSL